MAQLMKKLFVVLVIALLPLMVNSGSLLPGAWYEIPAQSATDMGSNAITNLGNIEFSSDTWLSRGTANQIYVGSASGLTDGSVIISNLYTNYIDFRNTFSHILYAAGVNASCGSVTLTGGAGAVTTTALTVGNYVNPVCQCQLVNRNGTICTSILTSIAGNVITFSGVGTDGGTYKWFLYDVQ